MTETTPDYAELIERLEKVEPDTSGEGVTRYYRNPDGPEAADALRTFLERNEALEARVTELENLCKSLEAQAMGLAHDLKRAEAKLAAAMKVIEPFAEAAEDLDPEHPDHWHLWEHPAAMNLTTGDIRAARALKENRNGE